MLLPGIVLPAEPAYGVLIEALGPDVEAVAKDLEVYATPEPPQDYSLEVEIEGVLREADAHDWARFHLVGYSGGGAASLALAAARAERLASLALLEPAWAGNWDLSPAEKALWVQFDRLEGLPVEQFMSTFMRLGLKPGVPLPAPPPGDPPPGWPNDRRGSAQSRVLSSEATSTARPFATSIARSTSRSALSATRTSTGRSRNV
jgi:pimeloyl-ACP methyl ester carboxylesterase